ncbi:hypothetical protein [Novosphingobium arvoryzae]|uniref:hypothetical protein n=1 Tax=Novosphingobium arvoryzae TaxID=1256514 RepID=UPI0035ADA788
MSIPAQVTGAWLMHHDQKLSAVKSTEFESITTAGRAARLLSYISKEEQWSVPLERVQTLAQANGIRRHEVAGLLVELQNAGVIEQGKTGVGVLGVSQDNLFKHANVVFEEQSPSGLERAALELSELASQSPVDEISVTDQLADEHKLSKIEKQDLVSLSKAIGFVDHEAIRDKTLLFNGSLFKRGDAQKSQIILDSLQATERQNLLEADARLTSNGCLPEDTILVILGAPLWSKLHQIGYYQVSQVTNENGSTRFVTKPAALVKYVPGGLADMHDDAKALASSLTYGILKSNRARGKIQDPAVLMDVLINRGYVEGWARAIKEDYQALERRGVVTVTSSSDGFRLTLQKFEIGKMARDLILRGDASEAAAQATIGSQAGQFVGPEGARMAERLKDVPETKRASALALDNLRKTR